MKRFCAVAFLVFAGFGCKGEQLAGTVNCKVTQGPAVECTVQQTQGKSALEVCWDFKASCPNGATLQAERTCAVVKDGGSTSTTIPTDKITLEGQCQGKVSAEVANIKWKAK